MWKTFVLLGMNLCGLFNLSVSYGYTSNVSRTVLERLSFIIETAKAPLPGLQLLTAMCGGKIYVYLSSF